MSIEIDNRTREIPEEPHWDKEGRANFLRATCPHPHGERLAQEIELNRGYIRGDRAEVFYGVLRPHLERREMERVVVVVNEYTPSKGELRRQVRQEADRNAFEARVADLKSMAEQGALGHSRTVRGPFRNKR